MSDHSDRWTKYYDKMMGFCVCSYCKELPSHMPGSTRSADPTRSVRIYKLEVLVLSLNNDIKWQCGQGLSAGVEFATIMSVEAQVVDWTDNHPLNFAATKRKAYEALFAKQRTINLFEARIDGCLSIHLDNGNGVVEEVIVPEADLERLVSAAVNALQHKATRL